MTEPRPHPLLEALLAEQALFRQRHPRCAAAHERGQQHYLYGAPSHWMRRWAGGFPLCVAAAQGARLRCADDLEFCDFCLGDSGAMCGHGPEAVTEAIAAQLARGATLMLPTAAAAAVGAELARRFALPYWGFTTSATDANRAAIRIARLISGRERVLVFNGCYHGAVDEALVALQDGRLVARAGVAAKAADLERIARVVEFNDLAALESALAVRDVACVLAEPLMTNYGMIMPQPGFHAALRELTRRTDTLLILDETHTFANGPGGYCALHGLEPDLLVLGKAIGGGIPVGLYGLSAAVAERMWRAIPKVNPALVRQSSHLGFGGTLAGSAVQVAAVRVVLERVLTVPAFERMSALATQLAERSRAVLARHGRAWHIEQSGARVETLFMPRAPRNATEVARGRDAVLEALVHVYFLNRGILITPFHCMLLLCPASDEAAINQYLQVLEQFCADSGCSAPERAV